MGAYFYQTTEEREMIFVKQREELPEIGKEEQLYIVLKDKTNSDQTSLYVWQEETQTYERVSGGNSGGEGEAQRQQVTKLGVVAPKTILLNIPYTATFNRNNIEVLKFIKGNENVLVTLFTFDNEDEKDFEPNEFISFDGTMKLKKRFVYEMKSEAIDEGFLGVASIDKSQLKTIIKMSTKK